MGGYNAGLPGIEMSEEGKQDWKRESNSIGRKYAAVKAIRVSKNGTRARGKVASSSNLRAHSSPLWTPLAAFC